VARHEWHVAKQDLIGQLQVVLQGRRLHLRPDLPEATTLRQELTAYQRRITLAANVQYGAWREGQHDDILLAVAVAICHCEHCRPAGVWVM
jgi:hypothetical protein